MMQEQRAAHIPASFVRMMMAMVMVFVQIATQQADALMMDTIAMIVMQQAFILEQKKFTTTLTIIATVKLTKGSATQQQTAHQLDSATHLILAKQKNQITQLARQTSNAQATNVIIKPAAHQLGTATQQQTAHQLNSATHLILAKQK